MAQILFFRSPAFLRLNAKAITSFDLWLKILSIYYYPANDYSLSPSVFVSDAETEIEIKCVSEERNFVWL